MLLYHKMGMNASNFRKKVELYSSMGYRNCYQFRTLHYAAKSVRTHSG